MRRDEPNTGRGRRANELGGYGLSRNDVRQNYCTEVRRYGIRLLLSFTQNDRSLSVARGARWQHEIGKGLF
jgi:hypothetical protein